MHKYTFQIGEIEIFLKNQSMNGLLLLDYIYDWTVLKIAFKIIALYLDIKIK